MKKLAVLLCFFVMACGAKQAAYYDTTLAEYSAAEMKQAENQSNILKLKTENYQERLGSLQIVFGMSNDMGDFVRSGSIQNNYIVHGSNTGFSKHYIMKNDESFKIEFNAFNAGLDISDDIEDEFFALLRAKLLDGMQINKNLSNVKALEDKSITINYDGHEQPYGYYEIEAYVNGERVVIYEYRTAYNGSIVRAFTSVSGDDSRARENMQKYAVHMTLKIFLDKGLISADEYEKAR